MLSGSASTDSSGIDLSITTQSKDASKKNAIAFCVDEKYLPYALFVAEQFIAKHPSNPCDVCICLPDISVVPTHFLLSTIRFIEVGIKGIEKLPVGVLSIVAYFRLFLAEIFKDEYQYILYLDADTYINRPFYNELISLIDTYPNDFAVSAAADVIEIKLRLYEPKDLNAHDSYIYSYRKFNHLYRNSGVLLFNVKNYVAQGILDKILNFAINNSDKLQCHDQTALNLAMINNIEILPFNFNWQIHKVTYRLTQKRNPFILHFVGVDKPWLINNCYTNEYQSEYIEFMQVNFPKIQIDDKTVYEKRNINPKYSNSLKESISINNMTLKDRIRNTGILTTNLDRKTNKILDSGLFKT